MVKNINVTGAEFQAYNNYGNDVLSDLDYRFNTETKQWDVPCIEWDGMYGTHWVTYASEEERNAALNTYENDINVWVLAYRKEKAETFLKRKNHDIYIKSLSTLGGQFPELAKIKLN